MQLNAGLGHDKFKPEPEPKPKHEPKHKPDDSMYECVLYISFVEIEKEHLQPHMSGRRHPRTEDACCVRK